MLTFGQFKLHVVRECTFKLDGGAMFGVVPKALWSKEAVSDENNCVTLSCNMLVIDTGSARVLVDTGMGPRWSEKERQRFALKTLVDHEAALHQIGLSNDQIDAVIISHMHFDHLGGAVLNSGRPTYPRAKYYVQRGEYETAQKANARARGSYRAQDWEPLEQHGVLEIIDGDAQIVPGVSVNVTGGHTSHHQVVLFESEGQKGVFFADIIPTKSHLNPAWTMSYDHYPLHTCDVKDKWLNIAARENWLVVFDHETEVPWGHVKLTDKGKCEWQPLATAVVS